MTAQFLFERLAEMPEEERRRRTLFLRLEDPLAPPGSCYYDERYVAAVTVQADKYLNLCEEAWLTLPGETAWTAPEDAE